MKTKIPTILFLLLISLSSMGQTKDSVCYTDSLTNVQIYFPSGTILQDISNRTFRKCIAVMEKSDISVYSMKSSNGKQYSWSRINEFDQNSRYGTLVHSRKIKNAAEGWHRYYTNKTKKGREYITCVTLIRGDRYAVYMVESAFNQNDLNSEEVTSLSTFPIKTKKSNARTNQLLLKNWIVVGIIMLFGLCFWKWREKMSDTLKLILICLATLAMLIYLLFIVRYTIAMSICFTVITPAVWAACLYAESWSDLWLIISKLIPKN